MQQIFLIFLFLILYSAATLAAPAPSARIPSSNNRFEAFFISSLFILIKFFLFFTAAKIYFSVSAFAYSLILGASLDFV